MIYHIIFSFSSADSVSLEIEALDPQKRELLEARFTGRLVGSVSGCGYNVVVDSSH